MNATKLSGTNAETFFLAHSDQQARSESDALRLALLGVLDAVMREKWLPMGLRALVVQELPALRRCVAADAPDRSALARGLKALGEVAAGYGRYTLRSETVARIQSWGAELAARQSAA